jgi:integrase
MPSVQNRSRFRVTVKNRNDLTKLFPHNRLDDVQSYFKSLKTQGFKPRLDRTDDAFEVRIRTRGFAAQNVTFTSEADAEDFINKVTEERKRGLFVDYTGGWKVTFGSLVTRYIREEAPKHKGFEMEAYKLNAMLEDAGCPRVDLSEVIKAFPRLANTKLRAPTGTKMRESASNVEWVNKPFAQLEPTDFEDYIKERLEVVAGSTVDREVDLFSAICRIAINTWRHNVAKNPMDGVRRPRYFNERDRRLRPGEEARLLEAARVEDRERCIAYRLEELVANAKEEAHAQSTTYARKTIIKVARATFLAEAEKSYAAAPLLEALVQFLLMTAARRSEALTLNWNCVDFDEKTAYLPETKNGRPRKLPLRAELVDLLRQLPRNDARVFPISNDALRKAWNRMCEAAGLDDLHVHDLRHEGISRVAETGQFSLVDLQAFSGHRDVRMLLRYAHLCARQLAERLDDAFQKGKEHKGRRRTAAGALSLADVIASNSAANGALDEAAIAELIEEPHEVYVTTSIPEAEKPLGHNVIRFPGKRKRAA